MTTYLHVGAPKTGTTFVQHVLAQNRELLSDLGVCYPGDRKDHWFAARELLAPVTGHEPPVEGAWTRIVEEARAWTGSTVVISHEHFRLADQQTIKRILQDLGPDIQIILTARDFARVACSLWQETVKNGNTVTFQTTLSRAQHQLADGAGKLGPVARTIHIGKVLQEWVQVLPPEHIHVVTMPHENGGLVWDRFAEVIGVDRTGFDTDVRLNPGLGVGATEFLRRLNKSLQDAHLSPETHEHHVKHLLANNILATQPDSSRIALPRAHQAWLTEWARRQVEALGAADYTVVGDLEDLVPSHDAAGSADATDHQVAQAAVYAMHQLVLHDIELEARAAEAEAATPPPRRIRRLLRRLAGGSAP